MLGAPRHCSIRCSLRVSVQFERTRIVSQARLRHGSVHANAGQSDAQSVCQCSSRGARNVSPARLRLDLGTQTVPIAASSVVPAALAALREIPGSLRQVKFSRELRTFYRERVKSWLSRTVRRERVISRVLRTVRSKCRFFRHKVASDAHFGFSAFLALCRFAKFKVRHSEHAPPLRLTA